MSRFRIGLAGATGSLGQEVVQVLEERRFPISEMVPFGTNRSLGEDVEILGDLFTVLGETPPLRGLDLLILCTPEAVSLELVREALRAEVPCIDCSGAVANTPEVPIYMAELSPPKAVREAPLIAMPAGAALSWASVLAVLEGSVGLTRVVGTVVHSASSAGRRGIEALSAETLGLLNQNPVAPSEVFPSQVAFDCVPFQVEAGEDAAEADGAARAERNLIANLHRLVSKDLPLAVTALQIPTFTGEGSSLAVETREVAPIERIQELFEKAPGLEIWGSDEVGPTTRDTAGRDITLVGRLRRDPSHEKGVLLWLAADTLRLSAVNAVKLAETRLGID
jgi:aspartate-semialdehyde dehydrogenase